MPYPGNLNRLEVATGLLLRSLNINNYYLFVEECNINQTQEIDISHQYIQSGPGSAIANIGAKKFEGNITCPIRVDRNNALEPAIIELLRHAEKPTTALRIDTNHIISHYTTTGEDGGSNNNELLSLDSCVIKSLSITGSSDNTDIKLNISFVGMIDVRSALNYIAPASNTLLGRALSWVDTDANRYQSEMRTLNSFELTIENEIDTPTFLMPITTTVATRNDQIGLIGVKSVKWGGNIQEIMRVGMEQHAHIHGGWIVNENMIFNIGPLAVKFNTPLFNISEVPLSAKTLMRKTKWTAMTTPWAPLVQGSLFTI